MNKKDINNYRRARRVQEGLKCLSPRLGPKETDVLFELYLTGGWTSYGYLRQKTGQVESDLSHRSLGPLETNGYARRRINPNHKGEAKITLKGKRLVERL